MAHFRIISDPQGLGDAVRSALNRRTQKDVKLSTNVDQSQVSRVMTGTVRRFTGNVRRVCNYANVDAEPFLAPLAGLSDEELLKLAIAACLGPGERYATVAQILRLLAKLR